ncbi:MAG: hypothetical protein ACJ8C4_19580 [Gemmataceae bacterium]
MNFITAISQPTIIDATTSEVYVVDQRDEVRPLEQVQARLCQLLKETPVSISALRPENIGRPRLAFG